jgi:hypothetical protein
LTARGERHTRHRFGTCAKRSHEPALPFRFAKARAREAATQLPFIRKHLNRVLRLMRDAEIMPWSEPETKSWEQQFPKLARMLPSEEGETMLSAFEVELERLKAA